jgi:F420H(2)-dependent quinone reductase
MIKHPDDIWLEVGKWKMKVHAEALAGAAREEAYRRVAAAAPQYGDYPKKTDRVIPVVRLTKISES